MSFTVVHIPVDAADVKVIKSEFSRFVNDSGGFTITIAPDVPEAQPSDELSAVMRKMFIQLLVSIDEAPFEEIH